MIKDWNEVLGLLKQGNMMDLMTVRDTGGRAGVMLGWTVSFQIEFPWARTVREAIAKAVQYYLDVAGTHLHWMLPTDESQCVRLDQTNKALPPQWLPNHPDGDEWDFVLHGGNDDDEASPFFMEGVGPEEVGLPEFGRLVLTLPLLWFTDHPGTFPDFVLDLCKIVRPVSGCAGIGILERPFTGDDYPFQPIVRQFAERFPGLDVRGGHGFWLAEQRAIKSVNWLTILSDEYVERVGGQEYLRSRLVESFRFYPYDGGLMIQAGPRPELGDAEANKWPWHYAVLAKVLKGIQAKEHHLACFHSGSTPGSFDPESTLKWLNRFDDVEIGPWPKAYKIPQPPSKPEPER